MKEEPQGYSQNLPILDHHSSLEVQELNFLPRTVRRFSRFLVLVFVLTLFALLFLPWRQFINGTGRVVAYDPMERNITVEAPLDGRISKLHVFEGALVEEGDILFEIIDNDPNLMASLENQKELLEKRRQADIEKVARLESRAQRLQETVPETIRIAERQIEAAEAARKTAELQFERIEALYNDERGLVSQREYELAILKRDTSIAEALESKSSMLRAKMDAEASVDSARASVESAYADLRKTEKELTDAEIKLRRQGRQKIPAPRSGTVYRVGATEGAYLKAGAPLCIITPDTDNLVVELWVDGNDMPLVQSRVVDENGVTVEPGSPARLQFEGWPAVQFIGWPSVAVGTFGGEVISIDPADDGQGRYRLLIAPKPDVIDRGEGKTEIVKWPSQPVMRQGIQTKGWILLDQVPLWFEVWRRVNGFPPSRQEGMMPVYSAKNAK